MKQNELPENAFRELKSGEEYTPVMSPKEKIREVTPWSVTWGIIMAIIFSAATAYLGLKVGQVFEAAIPITIISIGISSATRRKNPLGENVIIQSIGACSGMIVAGAIFTLPALYILQAKHPEMIFNFGEIFLSSLLGGVLGILMLIPFRKYFVKDMHGKYPFPEATASTQVLISGERGKSQIKPLLLSGAIGGLFDFAVSTFGAWSEKFTSYCLPFGSWLAEKTKLVFSINTSAAVLGMGYIVGLKYASIICFGSAVIWWIIIPAIALIFPNLMILPDTVASAATPEQLYNYAKSIGIGGIAMAGIIGIINSRKVIMSAFSLASKELRKSNKNTPEQEETIRTQRDISMKIIAIGTVITLVCTFLFFFFGLMDGNLLYSVVGILLVAVISFLFTTVAANAIAIVGSNPVSGMTLMTLILSSVILVAVGMNGTGGMVASLIMGGVVCTALSTAGSFITDLKIGYWLGSSPVKQESLKFVGVLVSAITVCVVIAILNKSYGFSSGQLAAPQANAMAAVIEPLMSGQSAPWLLYGIGAVISIILTCCNISALAFALGMFIPLELNLPLIVGGLINWYITSRTKDPEVNKQRNEKGTLLASGFIAGGALMGVVSAGLRFADIDFVSQEWITSNGAQYVSLLAYAVLIVFFVQACKTIKK